MITSMSLRSDTQQELHMLNQYKASVVAALSGLKKTPELSKTAEQLSQTLKAESSWSEVNKAEIALVDFYDSVTLRTEWARRLAERHLLPAHLREFYNKVEEDQDDANIRALLSRLLTDLHWQRESRRVIRSIETQMRSNIAWFFMASFVLFFLPTLLRVTIDVQFDNLRLYYLFTAATSGILGAAFSQLTSIHSRVSTATIDQVKSMSKVGYILARSMVGAGAGLIMFYLLQSGILIGSVFPEFIQDSAQLAQVVQSMSPPPAAEGALQSGAEFQGISQHIENQYDIGTLVRPPQGLSLLIIWCLLAGFSEKLIPGILNKKGKKLSSSED